MALIAGRGSAHGGVAYGLIAVGEGVIVCGVSGIVIAPVLVIVAEGYVNV